VNLVLKALGKVGMRINEFKYTFHTKEMEFLSYIISLNRIKIDPKKNIDSLELAYTTKCDRGLRIHGIREFLLTIY
jgi:hypothetical protein